VNISDSQIFADKIASASEELGVTLPIRAVSEDDLKELPDDMWDLFLKDGKNDQDCPPYQPEMVVI
jgi:hypothetical protein